MKKIFLTSGLAIMMASSAFASAHDIDTSNNLVGVTPTTAAACKEPTLGTYTEATTFHAKWTPINYTVTYHAGTAKNSAGTLTHTPSYATGGSATYSQTATYDSSYTTLSNDQCSFSLANCDPLEPYYSQTGYVFSGWRANYNIENNTSTPLGADFTTGGTEYDANDSPTYHLTHGVDLYAQWKPKKYDVKYSNGNCGPFTSVANLHIMKDPERIQDFFYIDGFQQYYYTVYTTDANALEYEKVYTPLTPAQVGFNIRTGYHFAGWDTTPDSEEMGTPSIVATTYGATLAGGTPMSSPWSIDLNNYNNATSMGLQAICEPNTYNVTYNPGTAKNGTTTHVPNGTAVTKTNAGVYDSAYTILDNTKVALGDGTSSGAYFTQSGYNFTGWMADYNINTTAATPLDSIYTANGTPYSPGNAPVWKLTNAVNLYAQWSPKKYPVRYAAFTQCGTFAQSENVHDANITSGAYHLYYYEQPSNVTGSLTYDSVYTTLTPAQVGLTISDGYTFDGWSAAGYASNAAITSVVGSNPLPAGQAMSSAWSIDMDDYLGYLGLQAACHPNQYHLIYDCGGYESTTSVPPVSHKDAKYKGALANASARDIVRTYDTTNTSAINSSDVCELPGYHITDNTNWTCIEVDDNGDPILNEAHRIDVPYASITGSNTTWSRLHNVKCTANWTPNTINLNWRPGDNATANAQNGGGRSCTFDLGITVAGVPNKPGYTFLGWTTDPNNASVIDSGDNNNNGGGSGNNNGGSQIVPNPAQ